MMHYQTRFTLVEKLKSKYDDQAWAEFYNHYYPYITAVIKNLKIQSSDLEDLVQKVMLVCWEKMPEFEYDPDKGLFRSWLIRIAKNTAMNYFSSSKRYSDKLKGFEVDLLNSSQSSFDENSEKEWRIHISKLAWKSIRSNFNEAAQQTFDLISEGHSNKEVSEKLAIKENTVAVYKKRIISALRIEIRKLDAFLS